MNQKIWLAISCALAIIIVILLLYDRKSEKIREIQIEKRDTVYQIIQNKPIEIIKHQAKIVIQKDTIIQTKPFIAELDTILAKDTIKMSYQFPDNLISLQIKQSADTLLQEKITIHSKEFIDNSKWWEKPLVGIAAFTVGIFVGRVVR